MSPNAWHHLILMTESLCFKLGGAAITTQCTVGGVHCTWIPRTNRCFLMTEWLLQPKPVKRGENVECVGSNAVISTISAASKENTAQSCVLIPLNPDHLRRVFSYLTFFPIIKNYQKGARGKYTRLFPHQDFQHDSLCSHTMSNSVLPQILIRWFKASRHGFL